jgi:2'-5' RNA ligase
MRLFLGIPLSLGVRTTLTRTRESILNADPEWRHEKWVADENLHVTLKFIGPTERPPERIDQHLAPVVARHTVFTVSLGEVTPVPRARGATMLWAVLDEGESRCAALAASIDTALGELGYSRDQRPFRGHATLCRARRPRPISTEALDAAARELFASEPRAKRMSVRVAILYASTLTPHGPAYEELLRLPLAE